MCPVAGSACDDGNTYTFNDQENGDCNCAGTPVDSTVVVINQISTPITIDGTVENLWLEANGYTANKVLFGNPSPASLSVRWRTLYDTDYLYVLAEITDDLLINDSGTSHWEDDALEIYVDADHSQGNEYQCKDTQFILRFDDPEPHITQAIGFVTMPDIAFQQAITSTRYLMEVKIPWSELGFPGTTASGAVVGIDVHVSDDDDGGVRKHKKSWYSDTDTAWFDPSTFGDGILGASINVLKSGLLRAFGRVSPKQPLRSKQPGSLPSLMMLFSKRGRA